MKIEGIELHTGTPDFAYRPVREVRAKCEASNALMPAPTENDVNAKLRSLAARAGANAVINLQYHSGVSMTSWKSMTGSGLAVIRESDTVACPHCAEQIKRAATKCRFCGEAVEPSVSSSSEAPVNEVPDLPPPLEETNNPIAWILVTCAVFVILVLIAASS